MSLRSAATRLGIATAAVTLALAAPGPALANGDDGNDWGGQHSLQDDPDNGWGRPDKQDNDTARPDNNGNNTGRPNHNTNNWPRPNDNDTNPGRPDNDSGRPDNNANNTSRPDNNGNNWGRPNNSDGNRPDNNDTNMGRPNHNANDWGRPNNQDNDDDDNNNQDFTEGRVTAVGGLTLRDRPTPDSRAIGLAPQGSTVRVFCQTPGATVDGNHLWYLLADGVWAWGSARYIDTFGHEPRSC